MEQWQMELEAPLPGENPATPNPRQDELEGNSFMAALQLLGD